jgi:hypothetical protein
MSEPRRRTVAVMQPYFFPYIGYFQLMRACDVFVVLDDVQYMKGGWINRNRILLGGQPHWLTFPVVRDSVTLDINQRAYQSGEGERKRVLDAVENAYRRAPLFASAMDDVRAVMSYPDCNVAAFNTHLLRTLHRRLGLTCQILVSSELPKTGGLKGVERVIDLCLTLGATRYVNASGGVDLYDSDRFAREGLELSFIRARTVTYEQFRNPFVPFLSIIDVMMFNSPETVSVMLDEYDPVSASA